MNTHFWVILAVITLVASFLLGKNFEAEFQAVGNVGSVIIGFGAYQIAKKQQLNLNHKKSEEDKKIIRENYKKLTEAIGLVGKSGRITDEAMRLFWKAEYEAKLELPKEIENYTSKIRELALKSFSELPLRESETLGERRTKLFDEDCKIKMKLLEEKPEEIYSKYLKIK